MGSMVSQITSLTIVYSAVYSGADQRKTSKLRVTDICAGNSPGTGDFPAQMASNAENVSIWWRHHANQSIGGFATRFDSLIPCFITYLVLLAVADHNVTIDADGSQWHDRFTTRNIQNSAHPFTNSESFQDPSFTDDYPYYKVETGYFKEIVKAWIVRVRVIIQNKSAPIQAFFYEQCIKSR